MISNGRGPSAPPRYLRGGRTGRNDDGGPPAYQPVDAARQGEPAVAFAGSVVNGFNIT